MRGQFKPGPRLGFWMYWNRVFEIGGIINKRLTQCYVLSIKRFQRRFLWANDMIVIALIIYWQLLSSFIYFFIWGWILLPRNFMSPSLSFDRSLLTECFFFLPSQVSLFRCKFTLHPVRHFNLLYSSLALVFRTFKNQHVCSFWTNFDRFTANSNNFSLMLPLVQKSCWCDAW